MDGRYLNYVKGKETEGRSRLNSNEKTTNNKNGRDGRVT